MTVEVHGRGDRLMAQPAGNLGDRHAFGKGGAGERVPQVMKRGVRRELRHRERGLPDHPVVVVAT